MLRISIALIFQIIVFSAISQNSIFSPYFPKDADNRLWEEALLLTGNNNYDAEKVDSILDISLELLTKKTEPEANLMVAILIADYVGSVGRNPAKGQEIIKKSGELFQQENDTLHIAWVFRDFMLAYNSVYTRNVTGIATHFQKAYNVLLVIDTNHPLVPVMQYNLMQAFFQVRKIVEGFEYFYPLIEYAEKNEDWFYMVNAYLGAGNIIKFYNPGLSRQFLQYAYFLAEKYEVTQHLNDPFFFISVGSANTATDHHQQALEYYNKGINVLRQNRPNNKSLEGNFYYYIGVSNGNLGNYSQAIAYLDSAATIEMQIAGKNRGWYRNMGLKGKNLNFAKKYDEALEVNQEVFDYFVASGESYDNYYMQNSIRELIKTHAGQGEYENALALGQKAIFSFFGMETPENHFVLPDLSQLISPEKNYLDLEDALYLKIEIMRQMAMQNQSPDLVRHMLDHFYAATQITDIHASVVFNTETLAALSARFKLNANMLLDGLAQLNASQKNIQEAYMLVAKSKAYLLQTENSRNHHYGYDAPIIADINNKLLNISPDTDPEQWETLNRELLFLEKDGFVEAILNPTPAEPLLQNMQLLSDLGSVHENIRETEIVIDFYLTEKYIHTFTITGNSFQAVSIAMPNNFNNLTTNLFRQIKTGNQARVNLMAQSISHLLFDGLNIGNKKHLVVIPDEKLHALPFDLLILNDKPILETMAISYRYSSHLYRELDDEPRPQISSFLAMAPVFDNNQQLAHDHASEISMEDEYRDILRDGQFLAPIPATWEEVEAITEMLAVANIKTKTFERSEATKANFVTHANGFDVIHLATHGFSNNTEPEKSGLALFEPFEENQKRNNQVTGLMRVGEISRLNINADLVVLSACKSGYGTILRGEGIMGISRGFIAAGANNVVASLWKVHDQKTRDFMITFYGYLLEGHNYPDALRLTKLDKLAEGWLYLDWAGFILIGG